MKPRQYVHLLLILSEVIIIAFLIIIIVERNKQDKLHNIYMGSVLLTVSKFMDKNNYETYPLLSIESIDKKTEYYYDYVSLLQDSSDKCKNGYKKCGILDTYGNIMCIPQDDECPINEVIVDYSSKYNEYTSRGYKIAYFKNLGDDKILYYTNTKIDNPIVVNIIISDEIPTYINNENFIFDQDLYNDYHSDQEKRSGGKSGGRYGGGGGFGGGGGGFGGGGIGSGGGGFRYLMYGDSGVNDYIESLLKNNQHIDESAYHIYGNIYAKNYIGFKDYANMEKYINIHSIYNLYFIAFPNIAFYILAFISIAILVILIIFSLCRFCHEDKPNEGFDPNAVCCAKIKIIIPFISIYIAYIIYIIYTCSKVASKRVLLEIKTDKYLEDLFKTIYKHGPSLTFIIILICLFFVDGVLYILAWILSDHFTKKYLKLLENSKPKKIPN